MKSKYTKIIVVILVIVVILLTLRVVFDSKFDDFNRFVETRQNYEGGTEKFDQDFQGLIDWEKNYKIEHPNATDQEINKAFKEAWGK